MEQYSPVPYLATLINCMAWTLYGLPIVHPNSTLVWTINGSGTIIEVVYIILFLIYSDKKKRLMVVLVVALEIIFIGVLTLLVLTLAHTHTKRSLIVGIVSIAFNIMMYASPLTVMVINQSPLIKILQANYHLSHRRIMCYLTSKQILRTNQDMHIYIVGQYNMSDYQIT